MDNLIAAINDSLWTLVSALDDLHTFDADLPDDVRTILAPIYRAQGLNGLDSIATDLGDRLAGRVQTCRLAHTVQ